MGGEQIHSIYNMQKSCKLRAFGAFGAYAFNSIYLASVAPQTIPRILGNKGYTLGKKMPLLSNRIHRANWRRRNSAKGS